MVQSRNQRENKKYMQTNENENNNPNLWDAAKAVLKGKLMATQAYLKEQEKCQIKNLTVHLKEPEKRTSGA